MSEVTTLQFFEQLHGVDPPGKRVIFTLPDSRIYWFEAADLSGAADRVERVAEEGHTYHGVCLQAERATKGRGDAKSVCALPGFWLDDDIAHPVAHKDGRLPPDRAAARELLADFPLEPSIVVDSGYGLQPYWLLEELWVFNGNGDAARAAGMSRKFQTTFAAIARRRGWRIDSTHDLARVLRVPGSWNPKVPGSPVAVYVDEWHPERRYSVRELESHLLEPEPTVRRTASPVGEAIGDGERNNVLASLAGSMRRRGMTREAITAGLLAENAAKCEPPLADDEVRAIAASVAGYAPEPEPKPAWPVLDPAALYGLSGEVVASLRPHTEADDVAVLVSLLTAFGASVGPAPHARADGADHPARLYGVLVGKTSRGRKGTAGENVRGIIKRADSGLRIAAGCLPARD